MTTPASAAITAIPVAPSLLGESPLWHPDEQVLYWVDIPGRLINRFNPRDGEHRAWPLDSEPGCIAQLLGGGLLLAARDGATRHQKYGGQSHGGSSQASAKSRHA